MGRSTGTSVAIVGITLETLIVLAVARSSFVLIETAFRDEGTSDPYRPPAPYAMLDSDLRDRLPDGFSSVPVPVHAPPETQRSLSERSGPPARANDACPSTTKGLHDRYRRALPGEIVPAHGAYAVQHAVSGSS
jgi:hypothetical protein